MGRPKGSKNKPKVKTTVAPKQTTTKTAKDAVIDVTDKVRGGTVPPSKKGAKGAQKIFLCPTCDIPFTYEFKPDCKHGHYKIPQSERVKVLCPNCKTTNEFRFQTRFILQDV